MEKRKSWLSRLWWRIRDRHFYRRIMKRQSRYEKRMEFIERYKTDPEYAKGVRQEVLMCVLFVAAMAVMLILFILFGPEHPYPFSEYYDYLERMEAQEEAEAESSDTDSETDAIQGQSSTGDAAVDTASDLTTVFNLLQKSTIHLPMGGLRLMAYRSPVRVYMLLDDDVGAGFAADTAEQEIVSDQPHVYTEDAGGVSTYSGDSGSTDSAGTGNGGTNTGSQSDGSGDSDNANSSGSSTPSGNNSTLSGNAYVAAYTLSVSALVRDMNTDTVPTADLTLTVTDERLAANTDFSAVAVTLTPHSGVFGAAPVSVAVTGSSYSVTFPGVQYFGGGQAFSFDIAYSGLTAAGGAYTLPALTLSQVIGQCRTVEKDAPAPDPLPQPDPTYNTPGLLVESAVWDRQNIQPGETVDLLVTVLAGTGTENLSDVFVELTLPQGLYAAEGVTGSLIGEMAPGSKRTALFSLTLAAGTADLAAQNVAISLSAVGKQSRQAVTGSSSAALQPAQSDRFTLVSAALDVLIAGQEGYLTAQCVNMGRQTVYNVTAALLDENSEQLAASYLGNLESGTTLDISLPVIPKTAAEFNWTFSVTYEGANGESHTLLRGLSGTVAAAFGTDSALQSPVTQVYDLIRPKDSTSPPFWCWLLLIAGCVTALAKLVLGQVRMLMERKRYLQTR